MLSTSLHLHSQTRQSQCQHLLTTLIIRNQGNQSRAGSGSGFYYMHQKQEPARAWILGKSLQCQTPSSSPILLHKHAKARARSIQQKPNPSPHFFGPDPALAAAHLEML
jgi:hypothetical protein